MAYTATEEQKQLFAKDHEDLKKIVDLGKEILWLTKEECVKAGPDMDETLSLIENVLIDHGRKEYEMRQRSGSTPGAMCSSMRCRPMCQTAKPAESSGSSASPGILRSSSSPRPRAFRS